MIFSLNWILITQIIFDTTMSTFEYFSSLGNVKPRVNDAYPYQTFALDFQMPPDSQAPNLIKFEFSIILREALNYCLKKTAEVFKVWLNNRCVSVNLETRQGQYFINSKNYLIYLQPSSNISTDTILLEVNESKSQPKALSLKATLLIHHQGQDMPELLKMKEIFIELGSENKSTVAQLQLSSLLIMIIKSDSPPISKEKLLLNRFQFYDSCNILPIGVIKSKAQIYDNFGLSASPFISAIEEYIAKLSPYSSVPFTKDNKLYLCHDMKGGYKEDTNFDNTLTIKKSPTYFYRNMYLQQSQIFNYFAHYNITLPPLHWRIACKRAQTKCIGTFIIQSPVYTQQTLMSPQFALFLIALARTFEFDGYLINIETNIKNVTSLIKWLEYLTNKIHQYIPNSVIIWYDSISSVNGQIMYQNCLNQINVAFFNATDGFFTNYWWDQNLLLKSVQTKGNSPKKVYIGNDCFGRNTYGGGKYDIYKATNKILEYKNDLSIALFAPGFTYEDNAQYNRQLFNIHQLAMYKGYKYGQIVIDKWTDIVNNWNQEAQWAVTSNTVCKRSAYLKFNPLDKGSVTTVQFIVDIGGTNAMPNSPYKVILQLLNDLGAVVSETGTNEFIKTSFTTDKILTQTYKIQVNEQLVGQKPFTVRIIQMGQSRLNWGGYYGPRFRFQKVYILKYEKERHWVSKISVKNISIAEPYHSLCNIGTGDYFSNLGILQQQFYNFLADYDLPHTHVINNPLQTQINYNDAFIGGTSLLVRRPVIKLLKVAIPKDIDLNKKYYIQVVVKDTKSINIILKYVSKIEEERVFNASLKNIEQLNSGWKRFTFELLTQQNKVSIDVRSIIDITSSDVPYSIGSIKILSSNNLPITPISCFLSISRDYVPIATYYLNLRLSSPNYKRALVSIDNYSSIVYFSNGQGCMYNAFIPRTSSFKIKVIDIDNGLVQKTICQKIVEGSLMSQLIFKGQIDL